MSPAPRRDLTPFIIALSAGAVVLFLVVGGLAYVGRTSGPFHTTIDGSFGVQARVVVQESNSVGGDVGTLVTQMITYRRIQLSQALDSAVTRAESVATEAQLADSSAPEDAAGANFVEAMTERAEGVERLRTAVDGLLSLTPNDGASSPFPPGRLTANQAIGELAAVGRLLEGADRSYERARQEFRTVPGGSRLPASVWVSDPALWEPGAVQTTVDELTSSPALAPFVDVHLVAVGLTPSVLPPVPTVKGQPQAPPLAAGVSEVPPTCTVSVTAVVRNDGSVVVAKVPIEAAVVAVTGGTPFPVEKKVTLAPSASVAITLPAMPVSPGTTYDLAVTLVRPNGQTRPNGQQTVMVAVAPFGAGSAESRCAHVPVGAP
jgi:hypothetical protein